MEKKKIQEQRMKDYFIQATKQLLKGEGLISVSARNIAEKAGYSYATLYNYFKDIKELVFECVKDFSEECRQSVLEATQNISSGQNKIHAIIMAYIKYFVQYPGIFELFFMEKISRLAGKHPVNDIIRNLLDSLYDNELKYCIEKNIIKADDIELIKERVRYTVAGLLLYYLNRHYPLTYIEFNQKVKTLLKQIIPLDNNTEPTTKV